MKIIKQLADMIEDELEGAEHYAECAVKYKLDHPALAAVFYEISTQEMRHVSMLHEEVTKIIKAYREKHGEPPEAMKAIYDWQHEKQIKKSQEIKMLHAQYREEA